MLTRAAFGPQVSHPWFTQCAISLEVRHIPLVPEILSELQSSYFPNWSRHQKGRPKLSISLDKMTCDHETN